MKRVKLTITVDRALLERCKELGFNLSRMMDNVMYHTIMLKEKIPDE